MTDCREKMNDDDAVAKAFAALLHALVQTGACPTCQAVALLENALEMLRRGGWDDFAKAMPLIVSLSSSVWEVETMLITEVGSKTRTTLH